LNNITDRNAGYAGRKLGRLNINTVRIYNATTGAPINANFFTTGLSAAAELALSGNDLFVANAGADTVSEYNLITGAVINAALIPFSSGLLSTPEGLAVSGNNLLSVRCCNWLRANVGRGNSSDRHPQFLTELRSGLGKRAYITTVLREQGIPFGSSYVRPCSQ
jgi:hypothetical protein